MTIELVRRYRFEAAHRLSRVPPGHPCGVLHGHSFKVEVSVVGPLDPDKGWLVDFAEVDDLVKPLIAQLDHHYLNEIPELDNPTSENLAIWFWNQLTPKLAGISAVTVHEAADAWCVYRGD